MLLLQHYVLLTTHWRTRWPFGSCALHFRGKGKDGDMLFRFNSKSKTNKTAGSGLSIKHTTNGLLMRRGAGHSGCPHAITIAGKARDTNNKIVRGFMYSLDYFNEQIFYLIFVQLFNVY